MSVITAHVLKNVGVLIRLIITVNVSCRARAQRARARVGSGLIFWARSNLELSELYNRWSSGLTVRKLLQGD